MEVDNDGMVFSCDIKNLFFILILASLMVVPFIVTSHYNASKVRYLSPDFSNCLMGAIANHSSLTNMTRNFELPWLRIRVRNAIMDLTVFHHLDDAFDQGECSPRDTLKSIGQRAARPPPRSWVMLPRIRIRHSTFSLETKTFETKDDEEHYVMSRYKNDHSNNGYGR